MSEKWQAYLNDPRTICKYGEKCYQKNAEHHTNYKHPPVNSKLKVDTNKGANKRFSPYSRKKKRVDMEPSENHKDCPEPAEDPETEVASVEATRNNIEPDEDIPPVQVLQPDCSRDDNKDDMSGCVTEKDLDGNEPSSSNNQSVDDPLKDLINLIPEDLSYHESTTDQNKYKELFLVEMPPDFFKFYECLKEEEKDIEKLLSSVNLQLIGPYDLLMGKLPVLNNKDLYLIHWRFYFDPPEFQAVLKSKGKSEFHIGYFRDEPNAQPVFLARSDSAKGCQLTPYATNIFAAVYLYLDNQKKTPFTAQTYKKMMDKIKNWAEKYNYPIEEYNAKRRVNLCIAKTLHGAGIMVPFNKKTELGYRKLVETDANIRKLFSKLEEAKSQDEKNKLLSELQPVITYANIAVDECDFGTGLEMGIDLFCSGLKELQFSALNSLTSAYSLLSRSEFGTIFQAHIKYRRRGPDMSVLQLREQTK